MLVAMENNYKVWNASALLRSNPYSRAELANDCQDLLVLPSMLKRIIIREPMVSAVLAASRPSKTIPSHESMVRMSTVLKAQGTVQAAFVPRDNVEGLIVAAVRRARKQVLVQAYLLSNKRIIHALLKAHARGVEESSASRAGE